MRRIDPPLLIKGTAFCTAKKGPFRFVPTIRSQYSSLTFSSGLNASIPALTNSMSIGAPFGGNPLRQGRDLLQIRNVRLQRQDIPTDRVPYRLEGGRIAAGDEQGGAFPGEGLWAREADPAVSAQHDDDLVLESQIRLRRAAGAARIGVASATRKCGSRKAALPAAPACSIMRDE